MFEFDTKKYFSLGVASLFMMSVMTTPLDVKADSPNKAGFEEILFTDFEDVVGTPSRAHTDLEGKAFDRLEDHENIGIFKIDYTGGNDTMRHARIMKDPENRKNTVLQYNLSRAYKQKGSSYHKGRIQSVISRNNNIAEIHQSVKMYLSDSFNELKSGEHNFNWLTLFEYWNDGNWGDSDYPFRITVNLTNKVENPNGEMYFLVHGQRQVNGKWISLWESTNEYFPVPVAERITAEIKAKEGKGSDGHFQFIITREDGTRSVIFDIRDSTVDPNNPDLNGFDAFHVMKLYSSKDLVDYVRRKAGKSMRVYWDDLSVKIKPYSK